MGGVEDVEEGLIWVGDYRRLSLMIVDTRN